MHFTRRAAIVACSLTLLGGGSAFAAAHTTPPVTDPAGDTRGGLLPGTSGSADLLAGDIFIDGDNLTFSIRTAAAPSRSLGTYSFVGDANRGGEGASSFYVKIEPGGGAKIEPFGGDATGGSPGARAQTQAVYAGTTVSATFSLSDYNRQNAEFGKAPLTASTLIDGAGAFSSVPLVGTATDRTDNYSFRLGN